MSRSDKIAAAITIALWIILFTVGLLVGVDEVLYVANHGDYGEKWRHQAAEPWIIVIAWLVVLVCHSAPNLFYLCVLSAIAGTLTRLSNAPQNGTGTVARSPVSFAGAALVGFLLYLGFAAGIVLLTSAKEFTEPTIETYLRRGPLLSLICFMLAYEPRLLSKLLGRLTQFVETTITTGPPPKAAQPNDHP